MTIAHRCGPLILPDKSRVLLRRMYPSSHEIAMRIVNIIAGLTDEQVNEQLNSLLDNFADRHANIRESFLNRFREIRGNLGGSWTYDEERKLLIGAHFMHEYSIESAALFNPSAILHYDQSDLADGSVRFIISLRATGEGHVSSITFRSGVLTREGRVRIDIPDPHICEPTPISNAGIDKDEFSREFLLSQGLSRKWNTSILEAAQRIMDELPKVFQLDDLRRICSHQLQLFPKSTTEIACQAIILLAEANYSVSFPSLTGITERVLFPVTPSQSNGIEDARFVLFSEDDGTKKYYATFTAYNGHSCLPQLLETNDFVNVRFVTLTGNISNKGMALFPRRVNGKYMMLSRQDDLNVLLMTSTSLYNWEDPVVVIAPEQPWEMFKMGNCGSPLETSKGWLVLTHGVGCLRQYAIGAVLLDLNDPTVIIGRMKDPLLQPNEAEREGYVPNVVYTCGSLLHNDTVLIPYAASDSFSSFATVSLQNIFKAMGLDD